MNNIHSYMLDLVIASYKFILLDNNEKEFDNFFLTFCQFYKAAQGQPDVLKEFEIKFKEEEFNLIETNKDLKIINTYLLDLDNKFDVINFCSKFLQIKQEGLTEKSKKEVDKLRTKVMSKLITKDEMCQ